MNKFYCIYYRLCENDCGSYDYYINYASALSVLDKRRNFCYSVCLFAPSGRLLDSYTR